MFLKGQKESKESIMSLTLSGLWLDLCFRSFSYTSFIETRNYMSSHFVNLNILLLPIQIYFYYIVLLSDFSNVDECENDFFNFILQQYPYDIPTEAFPFEIFKQAFVAVQSCVVHLQVDTLSEK